MSDQSIAQRLRTGDAQTLAAVRRLPLIPRMDNLVPRPWGGQLISKFKDLKESAKAPIGESFEIAAWPADPEARQFPSVIVFADGSEMLLPELLERAGAVLLGPEFSGGFPLLPKLLDIKELLSIQGHPPGNTEVYVIIDAEPGATLRLGFNRDMDPGEMAARLKGGRALQRALLKKLDGLPADDIQRLLAPWLARRQATPAELPPPVGDADNSAILQELHEIYWWMLDALNALPVTPGQVILNANPGRVLQTGQIPSAEVHALGNPERAEVLALEIRKPGPTFRAWDNVRFPVREVDVDAAIAALSLRRTTADDFIIEKKPLGGALSVSVDCDDFCIEHAELNGDSVNLNKPAVHCLHVLAGSVRWRSGAGQCALARGSSAIVPGSAGEYTLAAEALARVVIVTPKWRQ